MRERLATLDLDDGDIVGIAVAPILKSSPPPAPLRKTSAPPPPAVRASTPPSAPPPAPESHIALSGRTHVPTPPMAFPPPPVPTFDVGDHLNPATAPPPPVSMIRPASPPAAAPAPVPAPVLRLSVNDPTDLVFDGMYGLTFARSMSEAAELCAETLARALGARTVVIHTHDLVSGELRAIGAHGDGDFDIIGSAEASDDDLVASAVICNQKSVTMRFDGELSRLAPKRLHAVGAPRTLVATPAMSWGRCLAIIEVIDADERFSGRVADAASYVADHFAQFLSARAA
jgi:hypothetical protein